MNGNGFTVQGSDFNRAVKLIKKAFPRKKKDQVLASAIVRVADNQVFVSMPGAEVQVKAFGYGRFSAEIPFDLFKSICSDYYDHRKSYSFGFGPGRISVNQVDNHFPGITFRELNADSDPEAGPASTPPPEDTEEISYLDLPLLGIYYHLKKYPPRTLTSRRFMEGHARIEDILNRVDKLLQPLGLSRHTIEKILDERNPHKKK